MKRICEGCGGYDDAPKHVHYDATGGHGADLSKLEGRTDLPAEAIAEYLQAEFRHYHIPCCAQHGCPDGSCNPVTED